MSTEPDFGSDHCAYPNGYVVYKPKTVGGNGLDEWETWFTNDQGEDEASDAPTIYVFYANESWHYAVHECVPGPGPGDFYRQIGEAEVLERIRNYFFEPSEDFEALRDWLIKRQTSWN
jgi:hypothetical protein